MKTVDERLKSGEKRKTPFGWGYCWGVRAYRAYPRVNASERAAISAQISDYKDEAKNGKGRSRECAIGFMYGMRDAAIERKSRQKK